VVLWIAGTVRPPKPSAEGFDIPAFGHLPVLSGGRVQPIDTLARNSLRILSGKQALRTDEGKLPAAEWLAEVFFDPEKSASRASFKIDNPEVLGLFGWKQEDRKYFSYAELFPFLKTIDDQGRSAAEAKSAERTPYQAGVLNLRNSLIVYQRLQDCLRPEGIEDFAAEVDRAGEVIAKGLAAMNAKAAGGDYDEEALAAFSSRANRFQGFSQANHVIPVPPEEPGGEWKTLGAALLEPSKDGGADPVVRAWAVAGDAYRSGEVEKFNSAMSELGGVIAARAAGARGRAAFEELFNIIQPFYVSMGLCVLGFLLACASWMTEGVAPALRRGAFGTLLVALVIMSFGLVSRMYIQGRPPVTNLYSSAIFIGWGTVGLGLILDKIYKDGIGTACAGIVGFITLIIAHHLAGSGDTLEMMQAVLDTNIWLATHVVVITFGYTAMFLAGMLAIIYVLRGRFGRRFDKATADGLQRMVYGVICFATLFSFVGTVLGGIWADQSWGRFWGWDPKENGALLIVIWCALILHARWGGYIRARGLMIMAVFGNVITAFSWFGVNMLGVGLHSYGFMNKAFPWLVAFMVSQLVVMAIALPKPENWRGLKAG
jgi:ABC-type transport system involved in cytochrome c biogenesis permease subunit